MDNTQESVRYNKYPPTYLLKWVGGLCFLQISVITILDMGWASKKDCYPFIFTNIKGPILVKEEDMDTYIRNHEDDFIAKPKNPCQSNPAEDYLNYSTQIPTGWIGSVPPKYMITGLLWRNRSRTSKVEKSEFNFCVISLCDEPHIRRTHPHVLV